MLKIIRVILGLLLILIAIAAAPAMFHEPYVVVSSLAFVFLGLWIMGGISGVSSKSVGQIFLERTSKKTFPKTVELNQEAEEEYQRNPEFRKACLKLENELREKTDEMISQELLKVEAPTRHSSGTR